MPVCPTRMLMEDMKHANIDPALRDCVPYRRVDTELQKDGTSCGFWSLFFIWALLLDVDLDQPAVRQLEAADIRELMREIWAHDIGDQSTVTVHVRRLREKIEADPTQPRRIATIWGTGYRYDGVT